MNAYGFLGGRKIDRLTRIPQGHEAAIIARCQSVRSIHGFAAEPWSYEESVAYLRNAERVKRHHVTVPQPSCQPAPRQRNDSPSRDVAAVRAGSPIGPGCPFHCE